MIIGFSNGDFWKSHVIETDRFSDVFLQSLVECGTNAVELHCRDMASLDFLLAHDTPSLAKFQFVSIHSVNFAYDDNVESHIILHKIEQICLKYHVTNVVFHIDNVLNWDVIAQYKNIPVSIENMDDDKKFGRTLMDIQSILDKYNFGLTLDLQHCFVNDPTMKLAQDLQMKFHGRIVEYHISGFEEKAPHYPLYETRQDIIIESLIYKTIPIIIESVFDICGDEQDELRYIQKRLV